MLSWWFYLCGAIESRLMELGDSEEWSGFWYPLYNQNMTRSLWVQDWFGGAQPWWPWEQ